MLLFSSAKVVLVVAVARGAFAAIANSASQNTAVVNPASARWARFDHLVTVDPTAGAVSFGFEMHCSAYCARREWIQHVHAHVQRNYD